MPLEWCDEFEKESELSKRTISNEYKNDVTIEYIDDDTNEYINDNANKYVNDDTNEHFIGAEALRAKDVNDNDCKFTYQTFNLINNHLHFNIKDPSNYLHEHMEISEPEIYLMSMSQRNMKKINKQKMSINSNNNIIV